MTTSSADPEPPADVNDPSAAASPTEPEEAGQPERRDGDGEDGGDGTDPMGIDEDDPIDAALVGSPVEEPEREGATTSAPNGSDAEQSAGPE